MHFVWQLNYYVLWLGNSGSHFGKWNQLHPGNRMGDHLNILTSLHRLRHDGGSQERLPWWARPTSHRIRRRSQHPCRWRLLWSLNEPGQIIWTCFGLWELDWPLGILGWTVDRRWTCWIHLWERPHWPFRCPTRRRRATIPQLNAWIYTMHVTYLSSSSLIMHLLGTLQDVFLVFLSYFKQFL